MGLQLEKTGPSDAPTTASPHKLFCCCPAPSCLLAPIERLRTPGKRSQSPGNVYITPIRSNIVPEKYAQKLGGMVINAVLTLSAKVKMRIESDNEPITKYGVIRLRAPAPLLRIMGKSGKMHGANTVSTPARNARKNNDMLDLCHYLLQGVGEAS